MTRRAARISSSAPFVRHAGEGDSTPFLDHLFTLKASAAETGGAFSVIEIVQCRGGEPPLHVHRREAELFYLLDGEMTFQVGDDVLEARKGSLVFLPRDVPHTFTVDGSGEARVLQLASPAGIEEFFMRWRDRPLDLAAMGTELARYRVEIVGPPPSPPAAP